MTNAATAPARHACSDLIAASDLLNEVIAGLALDDTRDAASFLADAEVAEFCGDAVRIAQALHGRMRQRGYVIFTVPPPPLLETVAAVVATAERVKGDLLSLREVAELLKVSMNRVFQMLREGKLTPIRTGPRVRLVARAEVEEFMRTHDRIYEEVSR